MLRCRKKKKYTIKKPEKEKNRLRDVKKLSAVVPCDPQRNPGSNRQNQKKKKKYSKGANLKWLQASSYVEFRP